MRRPNKRCREILTFLAQRNWAGIADINTLFIPNLKYARRFMSGLCKKGWITQVQCPIMNIKGPGPKFYSLLNSGYRQLGFRGREPRPPTSINLLHHSAANAVLTGFSIIARQNPELQIQGLSEKQIRHLLSKSTALFIPDFALSIGDRKTKLLFLGEVDTGTETLESTRFHNKTIEAKFENMQSDSVTIISEALSHDSPDFTYLYITNSSRERLKKLLEICKCNNVLFTTIDNIMPKLINGRYCYDGLISRIWINPQEELCSILE